MSPKGGGRAQSLLVAIGPTDTGLKVEPQREGEYAGGNPRPEA